MIHFRIQYLMRLRRDFPYEIGWHQVLTTPVTEQLWRAQQLPATLNEAYGPDKVKSYGEYVEALGRVQPDRLMVYLIWRPKGAVQDQGWVQGKRFGALVEGSPMPVFNHLFRDPFRHANEKFYFADPAMRAFRPDPSEDEDAVPEKCLVHDRATGAVYSTDWYVGHRLATAQIGGGIQETLEMLKWKATPDPT